MACSSCGEGMVRTMPQNVRMLQNYCDVISSLFGCSWGNPHLHVLVYYLWFSTCSSCFYREWDRGHMYGCVDWIVSCESASLW